MTIAFDLPNTIPVFPLPGALLLPRSRLPLHIFEPRYLAMLEDCMKTEHRLIGMIQPYEDRNGETTLHKIGCAGRLTQFSETEDGRMMITLSGISRFRVVSEKEGFTPYRCCTVSWDGFDRDLGKVETDPGFDRELLLELLLRYFSANAVSTDWESLKHADDELLINSLSMMCPFDPEDKQALLEAPSLQTRRETLITLIDFALRGGAGEDLIQ
ncbi:MAG: LON peptidase substrate-binding domain-containing protein [Planktomarina sp.]